MGDPSRSIDAEIRTKIHDPIHGFVHLTEAELDVVDLPYFHRLRNIRQLAQVNQVFPGGEHTRFAHSLGVLWIMDRICRHLRIPYELHRKLRMAALLHDIGHFPLSHTVEKVYKAKEKGIKSKSSRSLSEMVVDKSTHPPQDAQHAAPQSSPNMPLEPDLDAALHERLGKYIIAQSTVADVLKKYGFDPIEIGKIVVGANDCSEQVSKQLMHSDLDADQMDYMLRDAAALGVGYGAFDHRFLIECLTVREVKYAGPNGAGEQKRNVLCVMDKGIHALDHYFLAKYFYYIQLLHHKTRYIVEEAAVRLFTLILDSGRYKDEVPAYETLHDFARDSKRFLCFDDTAFYSILRRARSDGVLDDDAEALFRIVLERNIPSVIYAKECVLGTAAKDIREKKKQIEGEYAAALLAHEDQRDPVLRKYGLERCDITLDPFGKDIGERLRDEGDEVLAETRDPVRLFDRNSGKIRWAQEGDGSLAARLSGTKVAILRAYGLPKRQWKKPITPAAGLLAAPPVPAIAAPSAPPAPPTGKM